MCNIKKMFRYSPLILHKHTSTWFRCIDISTLNHLPILLAGRLKQELPILLAFPPSPPRIPPVFISYNPFSFTRNSNRRQLNHLLSLPNSPIRFFSLSSINHHPPIVFPRSRKIRTDCVARKYVKTREIFVNRETSSFHQISSTSRLLPHSRRVSIKGRRAMVGKDVRSA